MHIWHAVNAHFLVCPPVTFCYMPLLYCLPLAAINVLTQPGPGIDAEVSAGDYVLVTGKVGAGD